jgi:AraC-like DNA-binding protein
VVPENRHHIEENLRIRRRNFGKQICLHLIDHGFDVPVTLKRLATNIGYANAGAFSRAFNRRLGVSPSEYRRQFAV